MNGVEGGEGSSSEGFSLQPSEGPEGSGGREQYAEQRIEAPAQAPPPAPSMPPPPPPEARPSVVWSSSAIAATDSPSRGDREE